MSENTVFEILEEAQIPGGETYLPAQPECTYAAFGTEINAEGSDYDNELRRYKITLELFELMDQPDPAAHKRLQDVLDQYGLPWRKDPRVIELSLRLYMSTYHFEFTTRR